MSTIFFAKEIGKAALLDTKATKVCLPIRVNCGMPDSDIVVNCGDEFNCTPCCDSNDKYYIELKQGDEFIIQTQIKDMFNPDPTNPANGFGSWIDLELIDLATGLSVPLLNAVTDTYVGWNGTNSYQLVKVVAGAGDTPHCFKIKYLVYNNYSEQVQEYCTQHFKFNLSESCENTAVFENKHKGFDCEGNWYNQPINSVGSVPFNYSNKIRLKTDIRAGSPVKETTTRNGLVQKKTIKYIKEYNMFYVPLYVIKYISNKLDQGDKMLIDGKYYDVEVSEVEQVNDCFFNIKILVVNECKEKC